MTATDPSTPICRPDSLKGFIRLLWVQPLWALPFALFFGLLSDNGRGLPTYVLAFKMSLIFSYSIGIGLWAVHNFVSPRYRSEPDPDPVRAWQMAGWYVVVPIVCSFVAAFIIHLTILPSFLGSPRAFLISGLYTLIFVTLFTGVSYAIVYYRQAVDRARAVETMRAELAEAELRAVRAQINPHFLFNTLNSIAALIRMDPAAAEDATTQLAEVFRYALRASDDGTARFADELTFLRAYLSLERTRFGERLRIAEDIEPGIENARVPSLLLQPLVENAVRYAVSPRTEGGVVRIAARRDGKLLRLTVSDDGPGMDSGAAASGTGFGLHSVRERLRAAGEPHAMEIRSNGQGTHIDITVPLRFSEHDSTTKGDPS